MKNRLRERINQIDNCACNGPAAYLNLDDAWSDEPLGLPVINAQQWGPKLRFSAPSSVVEAFYGEYESRLPPFLLYGSGDFHYITALLLRGLTQAATVISFDNHPDWDIRPPKWCCGSWVNRALKLPNVRRVSVWGCGNFECWWPHQIFGNRRAERSNKIEVHPWADDRPTKDRQRRGAILREDWQKKFENFAAKLGGVDVYITIDLDCLRTGEAVTNWENGRFDIPDLVWALKKLRETSRVIAGDICGGYSEPTYARWKQKFASEIDHPKLPRPGAEEIRRTNFAALERLWPLLTQ